MKQFEVVTHEEPGLAGRTFRARFVVRAGVPTVIDGIVSLAPGVPREGGIPVIVLTQDSGDGRTTQGSQLQAVTAKDARALAAALLEAAEEVDPTPPDEAEEVTCAACGGTGIYDDDGSPPCRACDGTGSHAKE